jgi:hypothetical protein
VSGKALIEARANAAAKPTITTNRAAKPLDALGRACILEYDLCMSKFQWSTHRLRATR